MRAQDLYVSVTNRIISDLEKGELTWHKPWKVSSANGIGIMPTNAATGRAYSGINIALLWFAAQDAGYPVAGWMTFQQARQIGASVRKGEKATPVVFTKWIEKEDEQTKEIVKKPLLKAYYVFNIAQLDNLPATYKEPPVDVPPETAYDSALKTLNECGIRITYGGSKAAYMVHRDAISMPPYGSFESDEAFFQTAFHEVTHATGHPDRLNRKFGKRFGDMEYAFEELVAELGSAFLCAHHNVQPGNSSDAAYIQHWLKVLREDNRAIFTAASHASQAADWVREQVYAVQENTPAVEKQPGADELADEIAF